MTNLESILKSRDITLLTKVHLVKAMVFPVVMYGCQSWTVKKAEHRRIDAFELWCWRRLLRVPWTARRSIQSILKEISPGCSLEGLMLKLKLQYFGHLMHRANSLEKDSGAGKNWKQEEKGTTEDEIAGWHHQLNGHGFGWTLGVGDGQGGLACCSLWGHKKSDTTEWLNWTELPQCRWIFFYYLSQEYTEELYKKDLHDQDNHDGMISHLEPDPEMWSQVGLRKHHYEQREWRWWNSSWAISNTERWCCESAALNMPANLENSAVATGLEKVNFHSNPKERQC